MESQTKLLNEISRVTLDIKNNYPELQKYLNETRSTLPHSDTFNGKMDIDSLKDYLETLQNLIKNRKA